MKKISIFLLLTIFLTFAIYESRKNSYFPILSVNSPTEIVVDLNKNTIEDEGETIEYKNLESFCTKSTTKQKNLAKKLNISEETALGLGFLAQNFAKTELEEKEVRIKEIDGRKKIFTENKDYEKTIVNAGFAVLKDNPVLNENASENIAKVKKLDLVILNNKSFKYHKLNCKYGHIAHNYTIIPKNQLPKEAKPCKFCHAKQHKSSHKKDFENKNEKIPYIKEAQSIYQSENIKFFLTDFTKTQKPSNDCKTYFCKELLSQINSSKSSIDFAIYGYTKVPKIQQALENAEKRGVKVRFVYDIDSKNNNLYPDTIYLSKLFSNNNADFKEQAKSAKYQNAIMHNKFFIFDDKKVLTGSANISATDLAGFNSNAIILMNSEHIANIYKKEFEQMYQGKFHFLKEKIENNESIIINDSVFSIYFSPQNKVTSEKIIPLIDNSKKYIYMPVFLITHKQLAQSLIRAAKRGVQVKLIVDATNAHGAYSMHKILRENKIQVKTENYAGKMHSKSIIIDDMYTIIGSMNFSKSGENINDENLIIIKNADIARLYKNFFLYQWAKIPDKWLHKNARSEGKDSIYSCSDGIDNNFDGKIDKMDDGCKIK